MGKSKKHIIKQNLGAWAFKTDEWMSQHILSKNEKEKEKLRKFLFKSLSLLSHDKELIKNDQYLLECFDRRIEKIESFLKGV